MTMQENRAPQIETITKRVHNDHDDGSHQEVILAPSYALEGSTGDYCGAETIWVEGVFTNRHKEIKRYVENHRRIPGEKWVYKTVDGRTQCDYLVEDETDTRSNISMIEVVYGNKRIGRWCYLNDNINDKSGKWEYWNPDAANLNEVTAL
jgi:hypothetical protein